MFQQKLAILQQVSLSRPACIVVSRSRAYTRTRHLSRASSLALSRARTHVLSMAFCPARPSLDTPEVLPGVLMLRCLPNGMRLLLHRHLRVCVGGGRVSACGKIVGTFSHAPSIHERAPRACSPRPLPLPWVHGVALRANAEILCVCLSACRNSRSD